MSALKTLLIGGTLLVGAYAQCAAGDIDDTCFENAVTNLVYTNIGYSGTWPNVGAFEDSVCSVTMGSDTAFSGPLAPLNEEITMHFRGPIEISNVAVYYPTAAYADTKKQKRQEASLRRKHVHRHIDNHQKRAEAEYTATTTAYSTVYVDAAPTIAVAEFVEPKTSKHKHKHHKAHTTTTTTSSASPTATGDWARTGYYDSGSSTHEGFTFMNNMGSDSISGAWTSCFGNTISYMGSDGVSAASSPECLAPNTFFPSNQEFSIWTNQTCDSSCGYSQPGTPAMKGFSGDNKVFVFKFKMPTDTSLTNNNMPAVWFLNSRIGRTWQYPINSEWTCWPYCGEFDVWEVLSPLSAGYMKSTLHSGQGAPDGSIYGGGGSGNYFERPYDSFMTGAVAFMDDGTISISVLDDSFDFPESLDTDTIKGWTPSSATKFEVAS